MNQPYKAINSQYAMQPTRPSYSCSCLIFTLRYSCFTLRSKWGGQGGVGSYYAAWICRFVSVDPLQFKYPELTPFQYASNAPITMIDLDGAEGTLPELMSSVLSYKLPQPKISLSNSLQLNIPISASIEETKIVNQKKEETNSALKPSINEVQKDNTTVVKKEPSSIKQPIYEGSITKTDNITSFEMWLDSPSEGIREGIVKIAANIGYGFINSPYSLITGRTIGGTSLNVREKTDAFVDVVPGLISGLFTKTGQVIKTADEGLQGYNQFVKKMSEITEPKGLPLGMKWQERAGQLFQTNKVNQQSLEDFSKGRNILNISNSTKKEIEK